MNEIINRIRNQLQESVDGKTQSDSQRFFKEIIRFYGVSVPIVNKISKENFNNLKELNKAVALSIVNH